MRYIIAVVFASFFCVCHTAYADDTNGTARAQVIRFFESRQIDPLNFGSFAPGETSGTVTVNASGTSTTNGITKFTDGARGRFLLIGEIFASFEVILPGTFTLSNGSDTMDVNVSTPTPTGVFFLLGSFFVDGQITVRTDQQPGNYIGSYPVTINFN